jgi:hypothetical protein
MQAPRARKGAHGTAPNAALEFDVAADWHRSCCLERTETLVDPRFMGSSHTRAS